MSKQACLLFIATFNLPVLAEYSIVQTNHLKYRHIITQYPSNSYYHSDLGSYGQEGSFNFRHNVNVDKQQWSTEINYELGAIYNDLLPSSRDLNEDVAIFNHLPSDDFRIFDLTHIIYDKDKTAVVHRLDRLNVSHQTDDHTLKIGRQAISWGNGLIYSPMDFLNPFDPTLIDTEYKPGDDMLYGQYLFSTGNDFQYLAVGRKDNDGNIYANYASFAGKLHAFIHTGEMDVLIAQHRGQQVYAIGGVHNIGSAVWRGDIVLNNTENKRYTSLVTSMTYSWIGFEKNMSGVIEYFHNGFGIDNGNYFADDFSEHEDLIERIALGELYTLGRDYLAISLLIEMTPLWLITPNLFTNLSDQSSLFQLLSQHDLKQDLQLTGTLTLPVGPKGTEYGGLKIPLDIEVDGATISREDDLDIYLSSDWSVYLQLAWYF